MPPDSCEQLTAPKTINPKPITTTRDRFILYLAVGHHENVPVRKTCTGNKEPRSNVTKVWTPQAVWLARKARRTRRKAPCSGSPSCTFVSFVVIALRALATNGNLPRLVRHLISALCQAG